MSGLQVRKVALFLFVTLTIVEVSVAINIENKFNIATPTQFLRDNCACADQFNCQCCVEVGVFRKENLCGNWTISTSNLEIRTNVNFNGVTLLENTFFGLNIPPICFPLLEPIPLSACINLHSLTLYKKHSLHVCSNAALRFLKFDFIDILLGCVDISRNGIKVVGPDHEEEVTARIETTTDSAAEIILDSREGIDEKLKALKARIDEQLSPKRKLFTG